MMTSTDRIIAEIDGREFAVISGRLSAIENDNKEIRAEVLELGHKLDIVLVRMDAMNGKIEDMKHYMSLTFGAIAIFVAAVALTPIVQKLIQALRKPGDEEEMRKIAREVYTAMNADSKPN